MRIARAAGLCLVFPFVGVVRADDSAPAAETANHKIARLEHELAAMYAKEGDVAKTVANLKDAATTAPDDFPMDVALWRKAVEASRKKGGSQDPDLKLIQAEIEAIRGKRFKQDVPAGKQSPDDFGAMIDASIEKEMPKTTRDDVHAGLMRLGLLPEEFDIKKDVADAFKSQAAAYYDPKQKKFFNLFSDTSPDIVETTAAHELVHALQDQYFDLDRWFAEHDGVAKSGVRNDDRTLALRCVVEGEATFVQAVWQVEHMLHMPPKATLPAARMGLAIMSKMELEDMVKMVKQSSLAAPGSEMRKAIDAMDAIQPYVLVPLMAAYMDGACFVAAVDSGADGWADVDKLYANPPLTSEQCLHPEKYAKKRDDPTPIALPEMPEIAAAGWRDADAAIHGELYFRVLLRRFGVDAKTARKAAAGWDGDLYRAWRQADGRTAIVLATTWDTEQDAKEFFDAYRAALAKKYEKLAPETPGSDGVANEEFRYSCGDEKLASGELVLRGLEVFAVEGFSAELREKIDTKLLATKIEHVE